MNGLDKFGSLGHVSVNGLDKLGMNVNEKTWRKHLDEKILFVGCITWMNGCGNSERVQEYVSRKKCHLNEKYVDWIVRAMVGMMVRGWCLPYVCWSYNLD